MTGRVVDSDYPYVCMTPGCGRVTYLWMPDSQHWLITYRLGDPTRLVVRCPQHISYRAFRQAGIRSTWEAHWWRTRQAPSLDPFKDVVDAMKAGVMPITWPGIEADMLAIAAKRVKRKTLATEAQRRRKEQRRGRVRVVEAQRQQVG